MPTAFDGTPVPEFLPDMPCGGTPSWDYKSECGYRCDSCNAVIGSSGQSDECKFLNEEKET